MSRPWNATITANCQFAVHAHRLMIVEHLLNGAISSADSGESYFNP